MKQLLRGEILLSIVALALAASVVMGREAPTLELIEDTREAKADPIFELDLSGLDRSAVALPALERDPFAARSFAARPPVVQAIVVQPSEAPPPAAPQALARKPAEQPAFPFRYVGRLVDDGQTFLFLAHGEEIITAQAGQTLGAQWRVEEITDRTVVFTYLPLKTRRSLSL